MWRWSCLSHSLWPENQTWALTWQTGITVVELTTFTLWSLVHWVRCYCVFRIGFIQMQDQWEMHQCDEVTVSRSVTCAPRLFTAFIHSCGNWRSLFSPLVAGQSALDRARLTSIIADWPRAVGLDSREAIDKSAPTGASN